MIVITLQYMVAQLPRAMLMMCFNVYSKQLLLYCTIVCSKFYHTEGLLIQRNLALPL